MNSYEDIGKQKNFYQKWTDGLTEKSTAISPLISWVHKKHINEMLTSINVQCYSIVKRFSTSYQMN